MLHFIFSQYQHVSLTHTLEKVKQVALKFNPKHFTSSLFYSYKKEVQNKNMPVFFSTHFGFLHLLFKLSPLAKEVILLVCVSFCLSH